MDTRNECTEVHEIRDPCTAYSVPKWPGPASQHKPGLASAKLGLQNRDRAGLIRLFVCLFYSYCIHSN